MGREGLQVATELQAMATVHKLAMMKPSRSTNRNKVGPLAHLQKPN